MEVKMGGKSVLQKVLSLLPCKSADHECENLYSLMEKNVHWKYIIWFNNDDNIILSIMFTSYARSYNESNITCMLKGPGHDFSPFFFRNLFFHFYSIIDNMDVFQSVFKI